MKTQLFKFDQILGIQRIRLIQIIKQIISQLQRSNMSKNIAYKHNQSLSQVGSKSFVPKLKSYQVPEEEPPSGSNSENEDANVSDDSDDAPRKGQSMEPQPPSIEERPSIQEQAHMQYEMSKQRQMPLFQLKKNNPMYSFSKNIDYSKITESQMRRHLKEKKQNSFQKIVPHFQNSSFKTSFQRQKSDTRKSVRFASDHEEVNLNDKENSDSYAKVVVQQSDSGSGIFHGSFVVEESNSSSQPRISHLGKPVQPMTVFGDNSTPSFKAAVKEPVKKQGQSKKKKQANKCYDAQSHRDIIQQNQRKPSSAVLQPRTREFNQASNVQASSKNVHLNSSQSQTSILKNGTNSYVTPALPTKPKNTKRGVVAPKATKIQRKNQQTQKSSSIFNVQKPEVIVQRVEIQNSGPKTMTQMGVSPKSMMRYQTYTEHTNESKKNAKDDLLSEDSQTERRIAEQNQCYFKIDDKIQSKKGKSQLMNAQNSSICSTAMQAPTTKINLVVCQDQKQGKSQNSDSDYSEEDTMHPYSKRGSILPFAGNTSMIDQKLSLGDFGNDQIESTNPFSRDALQVQQQKSLPYSMLEKNIDQQKSGQKCVSRIMEPEDRSMLYDSKEGSLERCVGLIEGQDDSFSQPKARVQNYIDGSSKESTFEQNKTLPSQIHMGNQSIPFTNRSLTFEDGEDINEMSNMDEIMNESQNQTSQSRTTVSKFEVVLKPTEKVKRCKADSFAPGDEVESKQTIKDQSNNLITVTDDQTCREFISSGDEITQFDQKQFRSNIADLTIKSGSILSQSQKTNQTELNILQQPDAGRTSIMSPQFGPMESQSKLRANDIMAPSAPIEMSEISNFKSPSVDEECHEVLEINHTEEEEVTKPQFEDCQCIEVNDEPEPISINFESILKQQQILKELRDILEIKPSTIQEAKKSFGGSSQDSSHNGAHAIDGLTSTNRVKVQQLCQEWWDLTQDDSSIFKIGLMYEQFCLENQLSINNLQLESLQNDEREQLIQAIKQKSCCIRQSVVLSAVVIGMTAFYSMLQRPKSQGSFLSNDSSQLKYDLELRSRLGQLTKIVYDQFILWQSFSIGQIAGYDLAVQNSNTSEAKLYQAYQEHIHLLFINKKIQSEDDYLIFNSKNIFQHVPQSQYVANEENRDYQINQLSKRLQDNCFKILNQELDSQMAQNNQGNFNLLTALKEIAETSAIVDFQESKNYIFEGISNSEVMPAASQTQSQASYIPDDLTYVKDPVHTVLELKELHAGNENSNPQATRVQYGANLIKNFNQDTNQIIHEESREESVLMSAGVSFDVQPDHCNQSLCQDQNTSQISKVNDKSICVDNKFMLLKESFKSNKQSEVSDLTNVVVLDQKVLEGTPDYLSQSRDMTMQMGTSQRKKDFYDVSRIEDVSQDSIQLRCSDPIYLQKSTDTESLNPKGTNNQILMKLPPSVFNDVRYQKQVSVPFLPPMSVKNGLMQKMTLVLDLDETLIHCQEVPQDYESAMLLKRPILLQFMKDMSKLFEIVIFTAGGEEYAQAVMDSLGDCSKFVDHVLHWDHVTIISSNQPEIVTFADNDMLDMSDGRLSHINSNSKGSRLSKFSNSAGFETNIKEEGVSYVKDLSKLGRDLSKVIIVDNLPQNYAHHPENGICIQDWVGDFENDKALVELSNFLKSVAQTSLSQNVDLRVTLQDHFDKYKSQLQFIS